MLIRSVRLGVCLAALTLILSPFLNAQSTGIISGTVSDATGSLVSGAKITVTADAIGLSRTTLTDNDGHYVIPLLPVAHFAVRVEFTGFQTAEDKDVRLQVDEHRELDFKLVPASVKESVEVTATEVAVETANPSLGQVITAQQVAELPLNGRDFVQLANLTPGTTQETNTTSFFNGGPSSEVSARGSYSLSVGGSRANSTDWLLDGNDNNELTAGGIAILPSIDAIQEFKVLTYNYSAEWGTRAGPTVLVTTKSGSNQLHGSLFEFFRNTDLDARSFFATSTEKFNLNQFGGSVGGAIQKDKTFFFADIQNKMQRHGIPFTGLVPTEAMRNGNFTDNAFGNPRTGFITNPYVTGATDTHFQCDSAGNPLPAAPDGSQPLGVDCNKIPQSLINPIGQKLINLYPLPNADNPALGYNYVNEPVRKLNEKSKWWCLCSARSVRIAVGFTQRHRGRKGRKRIWNHDKQSGEKLCIVLPCNFPLRLALWRENYVVLHRPAASWPAFSWADPFRPAAGPPPGGSERLQLQFPASASIRRWSAKASAWLRLGCQILRFPRVALQIEQLVGLVPLVGDVFVTLAGDHPAHYVNLRPRRDSQATLAPSITGRMLHPRWSGGGAVPA